MGDSSRKHSRKSKLVERTYEEIEDTNEVKFNPYAKEPPYKPPEVKPPEVNQPDITPKLESKPPIELSVNVEVESGDEEWFTEMIEQEKLKKYARMLKKRRRTKGNMVKVVIRNQLDTLNEEKLKMITKGQGVICVDSSYRMITNPSTYNYILTTETLLLSPYTAFYGPINYDDIFLYQGRSHFVYNYYCMACKKTCGGKHQFMRHLSTHSVVDQLYYAVTKFNDQPALICTTQPHRYISDCVVADIGIGNIVSIVHDYDTAVQNVVTKWFRSFRQSEIHNGILSYKCYSCSYIFEFYSQFVEHLNENHDSVKLIITVEQVPDGYINVVASSEFKPTFMDLTQIPNQSKYKCFKCKKVFDTYDSYKIHSKRINVCAGCGVELPCNIMKTHEGLCNKFLTVFYPKMCPCKREFATSREMTDHQLNQCKFGRTALVFNCLVCNYLAPSTVRLLIHQRLEHCVRSDLIFAAFKVNVCRLCGEKYAGTYAHSHYCKKRQDLVDCSACGMLFQNEYFLNIHTKAYPPSVCNDCGESFTVSCGLIEHGMKEHGTHKDIEIKYKCTACNVFFNKPEKDGDNLHPGHVLKFHDATSQSMCNIYSYKKIYMPKVMKSTFGYLTGIFPPLETPTDQTNNTPDTQDMEELINVAVIKKSNILSKSTPNPPAKLKKKRIQNQPVLIKRNNEINLSKTIYEEHNYDVTHETNDGKYEINDANNVDCNIENAEIQLFANRSKNSTVKGRNSDLFPCRETSFDNSSQDNNERHFKIEVNDDDCKADIVIEVADVKTIAKDNSLDNNVILDSFSDFNDDIIKCEPDAETMLMKTHVPVMFTGGNEAKPGCSKDNDFLIKIETKSDDDSNDNTGNNYFIDKPLSPKYPEEIGFSPQKKATSKLVLESEEYSVTANENKALKRKQNDSTVRTTKLKPNIETKKETAVVLNESSHNSKDTVESDLESDKMSEANLEIQENNLKPLKKPSKPRKRKRALTMRRKPDKKKITEPFRGFEPQEITINCHQKNIKITENQSETTDDFNTSECTESETINTLSELGESSSAETVSMKSEMSESQDDDGKVTVKLEIKEELYEEYETDLIIFDEANVSNEGATDEKFVEITHKDNLRESPTTPKIYFCKRCQFTGHHKGYKDHLNQCRKGLPKRAYKQNPCKLKLLKYNCIKCNLECDDLRDYLKHLPGHGYEELHCPCCNEGCENLNKFAEHVLRHIKADFRKICFLHLNNKPMELKKFRCCTCKMIVDQEDFFGHWQVHFDRIVVKKQPRDIRTAVMRAEYGDLARSMALEAGVKKEICWELQLRDPTKDCILCSKQFSRTHDIKRHLIEHLTMDALCNRPTVRSMKCQICSEDFDYTDLYKRHMRDHASLPLYQCQICDKSFSDSSNFGKHKKVHDVFEFVCDICRRKFQSKITLINHMMLHDKHKIITCEFCQKKFYFPSTFKKHMRSAHEKGIPKHSCTLCKTRFFSTKEQLNHEWREHGLRKIPIDCPLCDQGYRRIIDLKMHLKGAHAMSYVTAKNRKKVEDEFKVRGIAQDKINLVFNRLCSSKSLDVK